MNRLDLDLTLKIRSLMNGGKISFTRPSFSNQQVYDYSPDLGAETVSVVKILACNLNLSD